MAHNVYFDYHFLRHEFARQGQTFSRRLLCTVRLSRALYPQFSRHNLDSLIARHGLSVDARHRAADDANCLWQFYNQALQTHGSLRVGQALQQQLQRQTLSAAIDPQLIEGLPERPGVYVFEGARGEPLYIGKSINIRARVLSHFSDMKRDEREYRLAAELTHISTLETAGELGALIKEAQLVKAMQPRHNRQLRQRGDMVIAYRTVNEHGYYGAQLGRASELTADQFSRALRVYRSTKSATEHLIVLAAEHQLCRSLLGIETSSGACFNYHLKKCEGACVQQEPNLQYNLRFMEGFANPEGSEWPFAGPVVVTEHSQFDSGSVGYVLDKWCLLAELHESDHDEIKVIKHRPQLDLDIYHILRRYLASPSSRRRAREVPANYLQQLEISTPVAEAKTPW